MSELKPCPFCGGEARLQLAAPDIAFCLRCSAAADFKSWNRRAEPAAMDQTQPAPVAQSQEGE